MSTVEDRSNDAGGTVGAVVIGGGAANERCVAATPSDPAQALLELRRGNDHAPVAKYGKQPAVTR